MNFPQNTAASDPVASVEATLRVIASLPAPEGLAGRVQAGLNAAPRSARVLSWPTAFAPASSWVRGAAAAAIVCVVAGGGWRIYTHVQPSPSAHVIEFPVQGATSGGFSSAGAKRVPNSLNGPVLTHAVVPASQTTDAAQTPAPNTARKKARKLHKPANAATVSP
jgi:hypothetical protein